MIIYIEGTNRIFEVVGANLLPVYFVENVETSGYVTHKSAGGNVDKKLFFLKD